jgi:hypothetical protein
MKLTFLPMNFNGFHGDHADLYLSEEFELVLGIYVEPRKSNLCIARAMTPFELVTWKRSPKANVQTFFTNHYAFDFYAFDASADGSEMYPDNQSEPELNWVITAKILNKDERNDPKYKLNTQA